MHEIINGDCLEVMKTFPDNHFSSIVTDSPYGISFMGKDWDHGIPSIEYWEEMLRIVRPGGHLLSAGLPRMMHRLIGVIEDAGFEIRDLIMHIFGSGFPKSHNHFGIDGYGTALKPAWEGWSLAMKPLEGTFAQNAEKWGQAGINIDGCRIGSFENTIPSGLHRGKIADYSPKNDDDFKPEIGKNKGRWPANVIFDEEAAAMLDEQSGSLHSAGKARPSIRQCEDKGIFGLPGDGHRIGDSGGASRFFYCAKTSSRERNEGLEGFPEKDPGFTCRLSNDGLHGNHNPRSRNNHPTVKPLKLMEYLIRLVMPPKDGLLLDPFAGSGSTILAAKRLNFPAIGIEKSAEYCEIARARIAAVAEVAKIANPQLELNLDAVNDQ